MTQRVLIDACVLFPPLVRSIVIEAAASGLFQPLWSERIFEEWRIAVARKHGITVEPEVIASQSRMTQRFPDACVSDDAVLEDQIELPDSADVHVLSAAVTGEADILLTFNLRDFPQRIATQFGVQIEHPDGFLWRLLGDAPEAMREATSIVFTHAEIAAESQRSALKRGRLSRFGKALEAMAPK